MNKPFLSINLITYNHEKYIEECLNGMLSQNTEFQYEIVIGEDCSTDKTRELCKYYAEKYSDIIKLIDREKNLGNLENWHNTLSNCSGKYIALSDGDDYWTDPYKLQKQIDAMNRNPNCGLSFHPAFLIKESGEKIGIISYYGKRNKIISTGDVILGSGKFCPTGSIVFRKDIMDKIPKQFLRVENMIDYFLQIGCSLDGGLLYIGEIMSVYRVNSIGSWSEREQDFNLFLDNRLKENDNLIKLNEFLDNKYDIEIKSRMALSNYIAWKKFKKGKRNNLDYFNKFENSVRQIKPSYFFLVNSILRRIYSKIRVRFFSKIAN